MKVKVAVACTVGKVVVIDTDPGAQIGTSLRGPNGNVLSVDELRALLAGSGSTAARHRDLQGLQQGNDHPQYPLKFGRETVKGQWDFTQQVWGKNGTAASPTFSFTSAPTNGMYLVNPTTIGFATEGVLRFSINETSTAISTLPIRGPDGSAAAPTFSFSSDTNTGVYLAGVDNVGISTGGTLRFDISTTRNTWTLPHGGATGSAATPTWSFSGDTNTGMYRIGTDNMGFAANGILQLEVLDGAIISHTPIKAGIAGTAGAPAYSWSADDNTGIYNSGADTIAFSAGGALRFSINSSIITCVLPLSIPSTSYFRGNAASGYRFNNEADTLNLLIIRDSGELRALDGTVDTPIYAFISDPNTGLYRIGTDNMGFAANGILQLEVLDGAIISHTPMKAGIAGTAGAPAYSWSADDNTGIYNSGADTIAFSTGGAQRLRISNSVATYSVLLNVPDGSAASPSWGFETDGNSGIFLAAANAVGVSADGVEAVRVDANATAGNTRFMLYDVDNGTLERVSVGAADSGGAGFKVLRIPN